MHRRLSLVFLPLLYAPISFANDAAWNCEQNKDTKEWLCVGDEKPTAKTDTDESTFPESINTPVKTVQPALATPDAPLEDDYTQPVVPATVRRTQPNNVPLATEKTLPVTPVQPAKIDDADETPVTAREEKPKSEQDDSPIVAAEKPEPSDDTVSVEDNDTDLAVVKKSNEEIQIPETKRKKSAAPSSVDTKNRGWNCDSSKEDTDNWNCDLVGADPKGQARAVRVVSDDSYSLSLLDPAFDADQEQTFENLKDQLKQDPWENCGVPQQPKQNQPQVSDNKKLRDSAPLELTSDFAEVFDNEIGSYLGNVEIKRADQHSLSHIANYDKVSETLDLNGDVYYNEDQLAVYGRSASIKLGSDQAKLRDAQFIAPRGHLRGSSKAVYRDSKTFSRYKDVAYTSCRPGNQDWVLHASELKLNDETGKGAVKNAWVEFKGVPVFYAPYLSFPKDNRRLTGFLPPSLHYTQQAGVGIYTPYYWNIAPNYDATFTPRYLTSRGLLLGGDFRYLTEMTRGDVKAEFLPNDSQLNKSRYLGAITNHSIFTPQISSNLDLNYVSDKNYFNQLGNAMSLPNFSYLKSSADVNYIREGVSLTARADNYQIVDTTQTILPYRRLPQVNLNLNHSFKSIPMDLAMENESVYFQHGNLVNGERLNFKPSVSFPLQSAAGFVTPKLSLQHTEYFLSKQNAGSTVGNISRTLPIFSLDSGAFFEKDLALGGSPMLHTLEPRLFYLYIPYKKQTDIPLFDTAQYDFVYDSMFRENRFSSVDRIQDANQLTVALTSRLVDSSTGREKLKLSVGDIFYFQNRKDSFTGLFEPVNNRWVSPIIAELNGQLTDHVSMETGMQWDPQVSDVTRGKAAIHFINQPDEIINAGYYYRKNSQIPNRIDDIIQSDVSAHWPIYDNWSVVGRWQYSLLYNRTQEGFFGLEKENCCWRFRVIGRRYLNSFVNDTGLVAAGANQASAQGEAQTGIFFQVELKGLTGIGERLDTFFEKNIYGYRKPEQ